MDVDDLLSFVVLLVFTFSVIAFEGLVNMLLWNWIAVGLFHREPITWFWGTVAAGIIALTFGFRVSWSRK